MNKAIIIFLLLFGTLATNGYADFQYRIEPGLTVTITNYTGSGGDVSIPSTIEDYPVTMVEALAFDFCAQLTSVTIPDSVTSIGNGAFYNCTNLTSVTIPNSISMIEGATFASCPLLINITIPNSVTSIGNGAFYACFSLTNIDIPNSVTTIEDSAFAYCTGLTNMVIPESIVTIAGSTFANCTSLSTISIGNGVTSIGGYAFNNCDALSRITIPDSITSILDGAFYNCTLLTSVYFKGDAPVAGNDAFLSSSPTIYYRYYANGWGATFAERPTAIWPEFLGVEINSEGFVLDVIASDNQNIVLEMCTDMLGGNWTAVSTNSMTGEPVEITIPDWTNDPMRFYHVILE